jgi:uncharacterized membrane protein YfbV (UPF0208 family)
MADIQMDKSLLVALVTALITLVMSLGGAWIVTEKTLAVQGNRLAILETNAQELKKAIDNTNTVVVNMQEMDKRVERQSSRLIAMEIKVNALEVASARSITALENLADAVNLLSTSTSELIKTNNGLAIIVGKLEERTKRGSDL